MLDYEYNEYEYHGWIEHVVRYAKDHYGAEVDLRADEDAFIYEFKNWRLCISRY